MSFFKDLKEDIAQSVSELSEALEGDMDGGSTESSLDTAAEDVVMKETGIEEIQSSAEVKMDADALADLTAMYDAELQEEIPASSDEVPAGTEMDVLPEEEVVHTDVIETEDSGMEAAIPSEYEEYEQEGLKEDITMNEDFVKDMDIADQVDETEEVIMEETPASSEEITVITQGTTISGSIKSDTSLLVKGSIEGDVECEGKLTIEGRVAGNTIAKEIYVNTPRLVGDINSKGIVKIDVGTVVIGNINCTSVVVAGAVKGDIDVNGPVIIDSTAVVKGNVRAKSIQVNSGAVVDGSYSLAYADVDIDKLFEQ